MSSVLRLISQTHFRHSLPLKIDSIGWSMKVYIFYDLDVVSLVNIRRDVLRRFLIKKGMVVLLKNLKHETKAKA